MTATILDLSTASADRLDHIAATCAARAAELRRTISPAEARDAFDAAILTPGWTKSRYSDVGRLRISTANLICYRRYHPEQVERPMTELGFGLGLHPGVAREAVAHGVADGMAAREAP